MPTVISQVNAGVDDTYYRQNSGGSGTLSDGANDVPVGLFGANETALGAQMRFTNITVPKNATITNAFLTFISSGTDNLNTVNSKIRGVAQDNVTTLDMDPVHFTQTATYLTSATVNWDNIASWSNGSSYDSPNIAAIIQEIVNRSGWASGNSLAIQWDDIEKRTTQNDGTLRRGTSYNNVPASAPKLTVTYADAVNHNLLLTLGVG